MGLYFFALFFFVYGFFGWCTEVAYATLKTGGFVNRGFLNGPICPIYGFGVGTVVMFLTPYEHNIILLYFTATLLVTVMEGITGLVLDKLFHHKWWDYSERKFNIGGYVCLLFSFLWGVACVIVVKVIHPLIFKILRFIPVTAGILILIVLSGVTIADLSVTVAGILKFNRRLERMHRIADELHELSERIGAEISEDVKEAMEQSEKVGEQLDARREELRARYEEIAANSTAVSRRLVKAFPTMSSRRHNEILRELRSRLKGMA